MLCIQLKFLTGRYHATPWGRHVNEGVPEWPPAPYRLVRALFDVWKRRFADWPEDRFLPIAASLAGRPVYWLPPSGTGHVRLFQRQGTDKATERQKVFDAYVTLDRNAPVVIGWPDMDPTAAQRADLELLLGHLNYLGRSESWVDASLLACPPDRAPNSVPNRGNEPGRRVQVACLRGPDDYAGQPVRPVHIENVREGRRKTTREVAWSWLEAIAFSTDDLLEGGWSAPPLLDGVAYSIDETPPGRRMPANEATGRVTQARYLLDATVRPRVTETLAIGEQMRVRLMGSHRRIQGGDPTRVSRRFSGKGEDGRPLSDDHRHCFFWALDEDRDGFIDHLRVTSSEPFDPTEIAALDGLRRLWQSDGRDDAELVLTGLATEAELGELATCYESSTPFIATRHYKPKDGEFEAWLKDHVRLECRRHGLPTPSAIRILDAADCGVRFPWYAFLRSRKGERPRSGFGFRVEFPAAVRGPFALGYGCHFGLGLFVPARPE